MSEPHPDQFCTNCDFEIAPQDKFCPHCGQKKYHGPPTVWTLFADFFESVFNLDNRLFRTLRDLTVPGRLTNKFLAGKQQPYFRPLRLFFVSTVLMLSAYAVVLTEAIGNDLDDDYADASTAAYRGILESNLRDSLDTLLPEFPAAGNATLIDTIKARYLTSAPDSIDLNIFGDEDNELLSHKEAINVAEADFYFLPPDELIEKYQIEDWLTQYQARQMIALSRSGRRAVPALMGQLIWGILFLIPFAALMLKLFYLRRKRRYVEHLVFTLHVHAFLFLVHALAAVLLYWFESVFLLWVLIPLTIIYFIVALKQTYRQGWFKTLAKAFLLFNGYIFLLTFAFTVGIFVALALY